MNNRIKELIVEATNIEEHGWGASYENFDREKFAELIVRECAEVVRIQNEQFMEDESHYGVVSTDILKHFGIR